MATITICDVKVCGDVIKDSKPLHTIIAGIKYELCKKCFDGLQKFVHENLTKPNAEPPIQKLGQQSIYELIKEMKESFKAPTHTIPFSIGQDLQAGPFYTSPDWIVTNPSVFDIQKNPGIQYYTLDTVPISSTGSISITDVSKK